MTADRAIRALTDVVAVEHVAPGLVRVVTWSDAYTVDARDAGCNCPDKQHHDAATCKHEWAALLADTDLPDPGIVTDDLDARHGGALGGTIRDGGQLLTDGGAAWTVVDHDNDGNTRTFETRADAEDAAETARQFGSDDVEVIPPGQTQTVEEDTTSKVVDVEPAPDAETPDEAVDLPERSVADDPMTWMPGHFVDEIDGVPAVNRKGFEVLSHHYDISVSAELQVPPEDTDHTYARVKATATTPEGRTCEAFGSASVDRGDDPETLLEYADTRARKRALSIATGVGAVAVEELKNGGDD